MYWDWEERGLDGLMNSNFVNYLFLFNDKCIAHSCHEWSKIKIYICKSLNIPFRPCPVVKKPDFFFLNQRLLIMSSNVKVKHHKESDWVMFYIWRVLSWNRLSILVNLRYLRSKLLKYKEKNKKIFSTFDNNFKNIPLYIMRKVSLERYYFVLYDGALSLKMSKMALNPFCDKNSS